jgi:hypothetical protein
MEFSLKLIIAIFVLIISLYVRFCVRRRKLYKFVDGMPGPDRFWIPGLEGIKTALNFIGKDNQGAN